jgi:hypothetical protein
MHRRKRKKMEKENGQFSSVLLFLLSAFPSASIIFLSNNKLLIPEAGRQAPVSGLTTRPVKV